MKEYIRLLISELVVAYKKQCFDMKIELTEDEVKELLLAMRAHETTLQGVVFRSRNEEYNQRVEKRLQHIKSAIKKLLKC